MQCESEITGEATRQRCTNEGLPLAALDFTEEPGVPAVEEIIFCPDCAARMAQALGTLVVFRPLEMKEWHEGNWPNVQGTTNF